MVATLRWHDEERPTPGGGSRRVLVAWLVAEVWDAAAAATRPRYLAYLGNRPRITAELAEECAALYPDVAIDWDTIRRAAEQPPPVALPESLEELAINVESIALAHNFPLAELDARLGRGRKRPLAEIARLVHRPTDVARYERTSGAVFRYLMDHHPAYAYALVKLRLLLNRRMAELEALEAREPVAGDGTPRAAQVRFWLDAIDQLQHPA